MDDFKKEIMLKMLGMLERDAESDEWKKQEEQSTDARALMVVNDNQLPVPARANEIRKLSDLRLVELVDCGRTLELISAGGKGIEGREAAKVLQSVAPDMGQIGMYNFLRRVGDFFKKGNETFPYDHLMEAGFYDFAWEVNHKPTGPRKYAHIYFTAKGINRVRKLYEKYGIIKRDQ